MLLIEHDAKTVLKAQGVPVPEGHLFAAGEDPAPHATGNGPWMLKAQVATGKRGKRGGIARCQTPKALHAESLRMKDLVIGPHAVELLRLEACVDFTDEIYFSLAYDAPSGLVRIMVSPAGGVDVEEAPEGSLHVDLVGPDPDEILAAAGRIAERFPVRIAEVVRAAAERIGHAFIAMDATMVEINPLFVLADGGWIAGDAKVILDEAAFPRQPAHVEFVRSSAERYPEAAFKLEQGFDLIVLDQTGDTGLVTTGAGLTMMIVDELAQRGLRPYNFLDIRTGMIHADPARLIVALDHILRGPCVSRILINIFAGVTDLANFARRFVEATQEFDVGHIRFVARLEGLNKEEAAQILLSSSLSVELAEDLDDAIGRLA